MDVCVTIGIVNILFDLISFILALGYLPDAKPSLVMLRCWYLIGWLVGFITVFRNNLRGFWL